jgi:Zn-dependent protease/CBS domain-containing protein
MDIGFGELDIPIYMRWILGTITAIILFSFLFLHELAHSLVSVAKGYKVKGITFFLLGGISQSESFPEDPATELKIAGVGPLVSLIIGFSFILLNRAMDVFWDDPTGALLYTMVAIGTWGFYNAIIGLFNLIPAFPLDGGRILRSFLGFFMDYNRATIQATRTGKVVAIGMAVFGIIFFNILLILIAVFIYFGAKGESDMINAINALTGVRMEDVMIRAPGSVTMDTPLDQVKEKMIHERTRVQTVEVEGRVQGIITSDKVRSASRKGQWELTAGQVMDVDFIRATSDSDASDIWKTMIKSGSNKVVILKEGDVVGIASLADFRNAIQLRKSLG